MSDKQKTDPTFLQKMQRMDLDELGRLAEAAYTSGPWEAHSVEHPYEAKSVLGTDFPAGVYHEWRIRTSWVHGQAKGKVTVVGLASGRDGPSVWLQEADARFIAAFNPSVAKALLSDNAALRAERDEAVGLLEDAGRQLALLSKAGADNPWSAEIATFLQSIARETGK